MPLFRTFVACVLLAFAVPAAAQSVDELDHLAPALPEAPRTLSANERFCDAIDRYVEQHPGVRVAIRLPERTESLNVQNPVHLQILRYHAAAAYLASIRASGRDFSANQARAWAAATAPAALMDLLRRAHQLSSDDPLNLEWALAYPATAWCRAIRAGREPDPRQAQPGSLVSRFCTHNPFGVSQGLNTCRLPTGFGLGEGVPLPTTYDLRNGAILPLPTPGATVFGILSPSDGSVNDREYARRRVRFVGPLPTDLSALPVIREPPLTTP